MRLSAEGRMTASFFATFLLVCSMASGTQRAGSPDAEPIIVEPHTKLLPAGPGKRPFDVTRHIIPLSAIDYSIPRDAIPALARPRFVAAEEARGRLKDSDRVLGVFLKGEAKAYPTRILNWHELVNDQAGGQPILVSW